MKKLFAVVIFGALSLQAAYGEEPPQTNMSGWKKFETIDCWANGRKTISQLYTKREGVNFHVVDRYILDDILVWERHGNKLDNTWLPQKFFVRDDDVWTSYEGEDGKRASDEAFYAILDRALPNDPNPIPCSK